MRYSLQLYIYVHRTKLQSVTQTMAAFHLNFDPNIWIVLLIFGGMCCFLILLSLIFTIYSICALTCFGTVNEYTQSFAGARGALHTLAYSFTYLLWFIRIKSVFHNSANQISKIQLFYHKRM